MKKRNELDPAFQWDLSDYCKSNEECKKELIEFKNNIQIINNFKNKLNNKNTIFELLKLTDKFSLQLERLCVYANCKLAEDNNNNDNSELCDFSSNVITEYSTLTSFVDVEISNLSNEFLLELQNDKNEKDFSNYFREIIRHKKYILTEKEELLISKMSNFSGGFEDVFSMFNNADIRFEPALDSKGKSHELNFSTYSLLLEDKDRTLRENAYNNMMKAYKKMENMLACTYGNQVKAKSTFSEIRGYESVLKRNLYEEEITEKVYNNLIHSVAKNSKIIEDYFQLKGKLLKINDLKISDISASVGKAPDERFEFEKGFEIVKEALIPLGSEYLKDLEKARQEKWIDVYDNIGKDSGQFENAVYGCHPLVFLRYNGSIDSVSTLIHELGHAMHSFYSNKTQSHQNSNYPIFLAEIASIVNEVFLMLYFIQNCKNKEEKIHYYDQFLDLVKATIYRQTQFAEFEQKVFQKYQETKVLSKNYFQNLYEELVKKYYGEKLILSPYTKYEYSRIPHFYYGFYVYKYATGLITAILIVKKILAREKNAQENYIKFLSSGDSLPPLETLKIVGIDLENEDSFNEAFEFIKKIQKDFEDLANS